MPYHFVVFLNSFLFWLILGLLGFFVVVFFFYEGQYLFVELNKSDY